LPIHNGAEAHIAQEYLLRYYNIQKLTSKCEAGYRRDEAIQQHVGVWDLKGCDKASLKENEMNLRK